MKIVRINLWADDSHRDELHVPCGCISQTQIEYTLRGTQQTWHDFASRINLIESDDGVNSELPMHSHGRSLGDCRCVGVIVKWDTMSSSHSSILLLFSFLSRLCAIHTVHDVRKHIDASSTLRSSDRFELFSGNSIAVCEQLPFPIYCSKTSRADTTGIYAIRIHDAR